MTSTACAPDPSFLQICFAASGHPVATRMPSERIKHPETSTPAQAAYRQGAPGYCRSRRAAHLRLGRFGCIRATRRIVDVGPKQLATGLQFRDHLRGRTTPLYFFGPEDTTNTEAPTASRKARREEVRLPW